jgi:hypothetical protein
MTKNGKKCKKVLFSDSSEQTDTETCTYEKWSFSWFLTHFDPFNERTSAPKNGQKWPKVQKKFFFGFLGTNWYRNMYLRKWSFSWFWPILTHFDPFNETTSAPKNGHQKWQKGKNFFFRIPRNKLIPKHVLTKRFHFHDFWPILTHFTVKSSCQWASKYAIFSLWSVNTLSMSPNMVHKHFYWHMPS